MGNGAKNCRQVVKLMRIPRPEGTGKEGTFVSVLQPDSLTSSVLYDIGRGPESVDVEGPQDNGLLPSCRWNYPIFCHPEHLRHFCNPLVLPETFLWNSLIDRCQKRSEH